MLYGVTALLVLALPMWARAASQGDGTVNVVSVPSTVAPGTMFTWNITARATKADIDEAYVTFDVPGSLGFQDANSLGGCGFAAPTVTCQLGNLTKGASDVGVASITVEMPSDYHIAVGEENIVTSAFLFDGDDNEIATGDAATIVSPRADLTVFKLGSSTAEAGQSFDYVIVVENNGPSDARAVRVIDDIVASDNFSFISASGVGVVCLASGVGGDRRIDCALGDMAPDERREIRVRLLANVSTVVNNVVDVDSIDDSVTGNNRATFFVSVQAQADLAVSKTVVGGATAVVAGTAIEFELVVANDGPSPAEGVVLTDNLPAGVRDSVIFTLVPATASCTPGTPPTSPATCNLGNIPSGSSRTVRLVAEVSAAYVIDPVLGGVLQNEATVRSATFDPDNGNNRTVRSVEVVGSADLSVTKTGPAQQVAGSSGTFTLAVQNAGPSFARDVSVTDTLPPGMRAVRAQVAGLGLSRCQILSLNGPSNTAVCDLGDLAVGPDGTRTIYVDVVVDSTVPDGTQLKNTALVASATTADPNPANNTAMYTTLGRAALADVQVKKTGPAILIAGTTGTYTIEVTNAGPITAREVRFEDMVPAGMRVTRFQVNNIDPSKCQILTVSRPGDGIRCDMGDLKPDVTGNRTVLVDIAIASSVLAGTKLTNTATALSDSGPGGTPDPNLTNNSSSVQTTMQNRADLAILKTSDADVYKPSSTVAYMVTVANLGTSDSRNVVVTDNLPNSKQAVYAFDTAGCTKKLLKLTCKLGTIPAGTTKTFNVYVRIKGSQGEVVNNVTVTSLVVDLNQANNSSTRTVLIKGGL